MMTLLLQMLLSFMKIGAPMMIMSITSFSNKAALQADPLIPSGLTEFTAVDLVVCQSKTAREAVEVLASLLDRYGSSEINIALIADQRETWYVEMYNGHQYAAVKLPEDRVCAFGNEFLLEYVSDYEDSMGHSDISVTMNTYTHLGLEEAVSETNRLQQLESARKEQAALEGKSDEVRISKKMFRVG